MNNTKTNTKLTIEDIAMYLPYGLKVHKRGKICNVSYMSTKRIALIEKGSYGGELKKIAWEYSDQFKPILKLLSQLDCLSIDNLLSLEDSIYIQNMLGGGFKYWKDLRYGVVEYLVKNHYDFQGLIDQGKAISTEDIKEKVYE